MIDFTGIRRSPIGMMGGSMGAGSEPSGRIIARGQAAMAEFAAGRAARAQQAPTAARAARRQSTPKASPAPATASRPASTPEQRRVDAFQYPASWSEPGQQAIAEARAAAPGGAGVAYPAGWDTSPIDVNDERGDRSARSGSPKRSGAAGTAYPANWKL